MKIIIIKKNLSGWEKKNNLAILLHTNMAMYQYINGGEQLRDKEIISFEFTEFKPNDHWKISSDANRFLPSHS